MITCSKCSEEYRGDVIAACPNCSEPNLDAVGSVQSDSIDSQPSYALPSYQAKSGGASRVLLTLVLFVAVGGAAVFMLNQTGYLSFGSGNVQQSYDNSNSGGEEENTNVYNEDDSYEEEVAPQEPSGHYEQRCMDTYVMGGYDQLGNYIDGQWVEKCQDVWVQH